MIIGALDLGVWVCI